VSLSSLTQAATVRWSRARRRHRAASRREGRCGVEQLAAQGVHVTLKADTLFPDLDDAEERLVPLLRAARECGAEAVELLVRLLAQPVQAEVGPDSLARASLALMTARQPIASSEGYSWDLALKAERLARMARGPARRGSE